jgi:hypothetical protein
MPKPVKRRMLFWTSPQTSPFSPHRPSFARAPACFRGHNAGLFKNDCCLFPDRFIGNVSRTPPCFPANDRHVTLFPRRPFQAFHPPCNYPPNISERANVSSIAIRDEIYHLLTTFYKIAIDKVGFY